MGRRLKHRIVIGQQFGRFTVGDGPMMINSKMLWVCLCDCGGISLVPTYSLVSGGSASCGCARKEKLIQNRRTHGMSQVPEYFIWKELISRCTDPLNKSYNNYGGRGITVCSRWAEDIVAFVSDMGFRPSLRHSIDRINNNGNYEPSNCRWATTQQQALNRRTKRPHGFRGVRRNHGNYSAAITCNKKWHYLGSFNTAIEAAAAYDAKAIEIYGSDARINGVSVWERTS